MNKAVVTPYLRIVAKSKRIVLRPYKLTDFKKLKESQDGRLANKNSFDEAIPTPNSINYKEFKKRVERQREHGKMRVHFIFGVFDKISGSFIGQVDIFVINKQLRWANLGYHIQNQHWGKGYATEACKLGLRVAFKSLNLHRVEAATELRNKASIKVAKNIGMIYEGKRAKFFPDNGGIDMVVYGMNQIDFK